VNKCEFDVYFAPPREGCEVLQIALLYMFVCLPVRSHIPKTSCPNSGLSLSCKRNCVILSRNQKSEVNRLS